MTVTLPLENGMLYYFVEYARNVHQLIYLGSESSRSLENTTDQYRNY